MKKIFILTFILLFLFCGCDVSTNESITTYPAEETAPVTEKDTTQEYLKIEYDSAIEKLDHEYETKKEQIIQNFSQEKEDVSASIEEWKDAKANDSTEYRKLKSEIKRKITSTEAGYNSLIAQATTSTDQTYLRNECIKAVSKLNQELSEYTEIHESNQQICESNLEILRAELADIEKREDNSLRDLEAWYQSSILEIKSEYNQP